ncbi:hypothetical protein N7495_008764 [Penicillium taxi]|uniref:uncharacterized protein n=1 Tax=Penicillium taxi TaxID=168475 RepID=UPI0025451326|nr:uncharacterized protein N7495_008764 [Penicillium taxi]KAJ5888723.1 hypothetical protein N7495_008764 [Penicillium taxi]
MVDNGLPKDQDVLDPETQPLLQGREQGHGDSNPKFQRLGWKRLTIISIVEAIALGSLGLPSAFAALGMVAGVLLTVWIGVAAMYAGYIVGQVKLRYPQIGHYADIGQLMFGEFGSMVFILVFVALLVFVVGSHCLTGAIAFRNIFQSDQCSIVLSIISAAILMILAIPPAFAEIAILGYIDFASIILAIGVTMVATGIQSASDVDALSAVHTPWSLWPKPDISFSAVVVAANTIVFAYSFAGCLPTFMEDMHTPEDYVKTLWWLGGTQIVIYTLTGSIIYAFVGQEVQSPALLSAGPVISRVVFGIALPVIFISGSINTTVVSRYIHSKLYEGSAIRFINTPKGWSTWLGLVFCITVSAWVVSEAIPFFSELLSIISSLFVSGLSFYLPPVMWYMLIRDGAWYDKQNLKAAVFNGLVFILGIIILVCGSYSSIAQLVHKFQSGSIGKPFTCS